MKIRLYNTLTGTKNEFKPIEKGRVKMYHCGPTVYDFPSIGNMRSYIFADTLRRLFEYFGFEVEQVINITDVGHLVGDGDIGEDKIEKKAQNEGKSADKIARFYENEFYKSLSLLNIETKNTKFPRATEHIQEQIEIIKILEQKGFTYKISDGIYFDTSKFKNYGKLGNINIKGLKEGARVTENDEKKNITDFALWKFSKDTDKRLQEWNSPWGIGFPGWHIECSAMSREYLGQPFDIHTGGIDHIPVHHNNEIAQSECAYDKPLANYWLHNEFLRVNGEKMSKSLGNVYTLQDLIEKKIHPLSFRYFLLISHYSTPTNFTWDGIFASQTAFEKLVSHYSALPTSHETDKYLQEQFEEAVSDNLNTPIAISLLQKTRSKEIIEKIDSILGLNIKIISEKLHNIPSEILEIKKEREKARSNKDWQKSDTLRKNLEEKGFVVEDRKNENIIRKTLASLI